MNVKVDPRRREYVCPGRIVVCDASGGEIREAEALMNDDFKVCRMISAGEGTPFMLLDFGRELHGGISIQIDQIKESRPALIHICFGESVSEALGEPDHDHAIHEFKMKIPAMSDQEFGQTGFRFVKIALLEPNTTLEIRRVAAVALERPWETKGAFESSDPLLNEIWKVGAGTVRLCCQDKILDGIKRDRLVWMGDIHPQIGVVAAAFGDMEIVEESLEYIRLKYPVGEWMNGIASYSLWWIISLWEWYLYSGNGKMLLESSEYLVGLLRDLSERVKSDGEMDFGNKRWFLEWATAEDTEATTEGVRALMFWALNDAKLIAGILGSKGMTAVCDEIISRLSVKKPRPIENKQVNAIRVLAGIQDAVATNASSLSKDLAKGISPWFAAYILGAKAMAGDHAGSLELIREYFGGMLKLGATSFWEHFEIDWLENAARIDEVVPPGKVDVHKDRGAHCFKGWRHSLCHGWGGAPTAWLSGNILGVKIVEPGCRAIRLEPNLAGLKEVEGAYPTPFGLLTIRHETRPDGSVETSFSAPDEVDVKLA